MYVCNFIQTLFLLITENPLSLQSICRLKIRKFMGRSGLPLICTLDIPQVLRNFLMYRDIPQVNQCITTLNLELSRSMMTKWINVQSCLLGWWRQYAPLKHRLTIILHGSITQKTALNIILAAVRTWNLTKWINICSNKETVNIC
jgi:hypothetical protein